MILNFHLRILIFDPDPKRQLFAAYLWVIILLWKSTYSTKEQNANLGLLEALQVRLLSQTIQPNHFFQAAPKRLPDKIFSQSVRPPGWAEKLSLSDVGLCPMARPSPPRLKANVALVSFGLGVATSIQTS